MDKRRSWKTKSIKKQNSLQITKAIFCALITSKIASMERNRYIIQIQNFKYFFYFKPFIYLLFTLHDFTLKFYLSIQIQVQVATGICLLKVSNRNNRTTGCGLCSNLTKKTPARRNLELISHLALVFLLSTLNM